MGGTVKGPKRLRIPVKQEGAGQTVNPVWITAHTKDETMTICTRDIKQLHNYLNNLKQLIDGKRI